MFKLGFVVPVTCVHIFLCQQNRFNHKKGEIQTDALGSELNVFSVLLVSRFIFYFFGWKTDLSGVTWSKTE